MKTNQTLKYVRYGLIFAVGIFLGRMFFGGPSKQDIVAEHVHPESEAQIWTCSMHPQIRQDHPGKCPLCAMDLIPVASVTGHSQNADAIQMSEEAIALANIQTTVVRRSHPVKEMRLYGIIKPNERLLHSLTSHVSGRIEALSVNFTGETIHEGQVVAKIYSPDLLNAQQELLEAKKLETTQPALLDAVREKLRLWKLSDRQIAEIEQTGKASPTIDILANASGVVIDKKVEQGDYVNQGAVLFDLANLSSVWAMFDAYESDLPYLKTGDLVTYTLQTLPGKTFSGKIAFIDPILDKTTRTAKVRVETANPRLELKPEMFANALVKTALKRQENAIVIPKTALLWTGKRSIVYVRQPDTDLPVFNLREIDLGVSLGNEYVVLSGLSDGEEIVTNGAFAIDASAQLEGKPSMMNGESSLSPQASQIATLQVQGLCEMCKERIEKTAKNITGISSAVWDIETKRLHLRYNPELTSSDAVAKALAKAGHDTEKHQASDEVYNALPACCQYRK
jgi:Cu(I)/Ag(I) efflux system membrane fusion protein